MRRREFITLIGSSASIWPLVARAQQAGRIRHVGVLTGFDDPDLKAFQQELGRLGWSEANLHIDYRYSPAGTGAEALARELVALGPEVILAQSRPAITALKKSNRYHPNCIRIRYRPNRRWPHSKSAPSRRKHHRI